MTANDILAICNIVIAACWIYVAYKWSRVHSARRKSYEADALLANAMRQGVEEMQRMTSDAFEMRWGKIDESDSLQHVQDLEADNAVPDHIGRTDDPAGPV